MKNKTSIFLISILALSSLMIMASQPAQAQTETIVIGVVSGGANAYNVTEVTVQPNTQYTIKFVNTDAMMGHNLRIDVDGDVSDTNLDDADDLLIGLANNATGDYTGEWTAEWTSPDSGEVQYYCGFPGHYAGGMVGYFVVEGGSSAPGFGLFSGIVALFIFSLAIPTLRRN